MNILITGFPKAGSTVITFIIKELLNLKFLNEKINETFLPIILPFKNRIINNNEFFLGLEFIDQIKENKINCQFIIYDSYKKIVNTSYQVPIENELIYSLIFFNNFIFRTHEYPDNILKNKLFNNFFKICIIRNPFDVIHSSMKYINESSEVYNLLKIYKEKEDFIFYRYAQIDNFINILERWKRFVKGYLKNESCFKLIKFEDFISFPRESIIKLFPEVDKSKLEKILNKFLYKDLVKNVNKPKYFKHYNPEKKIGDFNYYFSDSMYRCVIDETENLIKKLNYNLNELIQIDSIKCKDIELLEEKYKKINSIKILEKKNRDAFLSWINELIKENKFALYGYGEYGKTLLRHIKFMKNVICIIDDNKASTISMIDNIPLIPIEKIKTYLKKIEFIGLCISPTYESDVREKLYLNGISSLEVINFYNKYFNKIDVLKE